MKQLVLRITDELHRQLKVAAAAAGESMQGLILDAMRASAKTGEILKQAEKKS